MLYIVYREPGRQIPTVMSWHVGDVLPFDFRDHVQEVTEVQADGDELQLILDQATGLPMVNRIGNYPRVQHWYGDHAKWIVANLLR